MRYMHDFNLDPLPECHRAGSLRATHYCAPLMMMIVFMTFNSSLVPLIEGLCSSNPWEFEIFEV